MNEQSPEPLRTLSPRGAGADDKFGEFKWFTIGKLLIHVLRHWPCITADRTRTDRRHGPRAVRNQLPRLRHHRALGCRYQEDTGQPKVIQVAQVFGR